MELSLRPQGYQKSEEWLGGVSRGLSGGNMKTALVCGAGGFIGSHIVKRLKREGFTRSGVDLKFPDFSETLADDFVVGDLRSQELCQAIVARKFD
jgi:GDP-D-mannose 3', 5'-epimerase